MLTWNKKALLAMAREERLRLIVIPSCDHTIGSESVSLYLSILEVNIKS